MRPRNWLITSEIRVAKSRFRGTTSATKTERFFSEVKKRFPCCVPSLSTVLKFSSPTNVRASPVRVDQSKKLITSP